MPGDEPSSDSVTFWPVGPGGAKAVLPVRLLGGALRGVISVIVLVMLGVATLLVMAGCTIERVVLYNYEQPTPPKATPLGKIGPT